MPYCSACGVAVMIGGSHSCLRYQNGTVVDDDDPSQLNFASPEKLLAGESEDLDGEDIAGIFDDPLDIDLAEALSFRMIDTGIEDYTVEFAHLPHQPRLSGPMLLR